MTPKSLEDYAAMRLAGEHIECLCDEYAHLVLHQAAEIKQLKAKIKEMRWPAFLDRLDEKVESINRETEKIKRIDEKCPALNLTTTTTTS